MATKKPTTKGKRPATRKPAKGAAPRATPARQSAMLEAKLAAVRDIGAALASSLGLDALFERIVPNVSRLMSAKRTTLFLYDAGAHEIWSKVAQGNDVQEIRLHLGQGLAGWVAEHRKPLNIPDAYSDPRFDPTVDARSGFRTRSVAAAPVLNRAGELLGVLQVLNHEGGAFSEEDIGLLDAIAVQTAYAVENAQQAQLLIDQNRELEAARQRAERRRNELDLLYQLEQETSVSDNLDALLDSIIVRTCERLRSEAGSVLLSDERTGRLFFRGVMGEHQAALRQLALDPGEGIVGWAALHEQPVIVNRPEDDPRHDHDLAAKLQYPAKAVLAVPLIWDQHVIGAVEVLNPRARPTGATGYDLEDMKVLTVIAGQLARAVSLTRERQARMDTLRLAAIGRMLAGVAHDLRNPMTVISGYAQLMALEPDATDRQARSERILHQIDEMTAMIGDLLSFARGDTRLHCAEVEPQRLAEEIRETLLPQCEPRGIALEVQGRGGAIRADQGRIKRIVFNLAKNAVEVLKRGDALNVELAERQGDLRIRVVDNGPGIPEEIRARLFTPFVTSGKVHGTGLGLSIVKRFVDDHGGTIELESSHDKGTAFSVHIPHTHD